MSSAPWPYGDDDAPQSPGFPTWECPTGECQCHPTKADAEPFEVSIRLYTHDGEAMSGARCRVLHQGRELNPDDSNADAAGWITVVVPSAPTMLLVEWAPPDTPEKPDLPHRAWYYVDLEKPGDTPIQRRLHNLGFSLERSLADNVKAFQREYGYEDVDGLTESIRENLITYHDEGRVPVRLWGTRAPAEHGGDPSDLPPPTANVAPSDPGILPVRAPAQTSRGDGAPQIAFALKAKGKGAKNAGTPPASPPPAPASKGKTKLSDGSVKPARKLPDLLDVLMRRQTVGEWFRIHVVKGSLEGYFWILGDALLWNVPDEEKWKWWDESYCPTTPNPHFGKVINRRRLCRLPCSAVEGSDVARLIRTKRSLLKGIKGKDSTDIDPQDGDLEGTDKSIGSVMPTTLLYDTLYLQADVQIQFQPVIGFGTANVPPVHKMVNDYNKKVNAAALAAFNKSGSATMPRSLGTPGKIWAIHPDTERVQYSEFEHRKLTQGCAINYGFHKCPPRDRADPFQPASTAHGNDHTNDYSQILSVVAGYCAVRASSNDPFVWKKTADVYTSATTPSFAPLVNKTGKPMVQSVYNNRSRPDTPEEQKEGRTPNGSFTTKP